MSIFYLKENERVVVFRYGHIHKLAGPGLVILFPIIDKGLKINMDEHIPGWQGLSEDILLQQIERLIIDDELFFE
ncbi:hypothetical protein DRQ33_04065 [bacterium]|nr:MAG: hypothetical protein DRQ33_04065 [bacterium]